jgi:hypothetical protein
MRAIVVVGEFRLSFMWSIGVTWWHRRQFTVIEASSVRSATVFIPSA